jgi:hypothetical protein
MTKYVNPTHIIGERGVIRFNDYCNRHIPYIIFREVTKHDFGIDGELEIVKNNENEKPIATGEILKVQIKSTNSDDSYIRNETEKSFNFFAKKEDVEYWKKYKLGVLLVIYDNKTDTLYCKKVNDQDLYLAEKKHHSIIFSKEDNKLEFGKNDFIQRFSSDFKSRINYDAKETLSTNLLQFSALPKQMFVYSTSFTNKKTVYEAIEADNAPYFVLYNQRLYTFESLKLYHKDFYAQITNNDPGEYYTLSQIIADKDLKNHFVEVLNVYIKKLLSDKRMRYSRDYKRFYFRKPNNNENLVVTYRTKKQKRSMDKEVVKYFEYGKDKFYRHWALELKLIFIDNRFYLQLNPKYYFTFDGKETLRPEKITEYTNYLTSRERNAAVLNQIHFYLDYLSGGESTIDIWNFHGVEIKLKSAPIQFMASFGIPLDIQPKDKKEKTSPFPFQKKLLLDDED